MNIKTRACTSGRCTTDKVRALFCRALFCRALFCRALTSHTRLKRQKAKHIDQTKKKQTILILKM